MANFLDVTADIDLRLNEYGARLARIEAHMRRGETRAARARLTGLLQELVDFAREVELPLETVVVGAQLGFFSGGAIFRGRLPGALLGAVTGWLYGQQVLQRHRLMLEAIVEKTMAITLYLEMQEDKEVSGEGDREGAPEASHDSPLQQDSPETPSDESTRVTAEIDRPEGS